MNRPYRVASAFYARLVDLDDRLFGCSHRRTTFPMTLWNGASTRKETYIACLACGRHFAYDWTAMQVNRQRLDWAGMNVVLIPAHAGRR